MPIMWFNAIARKSPRPARGKKRVRILCRYLVNPDRGQCNGPSLSAVFGPPIVPVTVSCTIADTLSGSRISGGSTSSMRLASPRSSICKRAAFSSAAGSAFFRGKVHAEAEMIYVGIGKNPDQPTDSGLHLNLCAA